jgi:intraflagellar transport protein 81
MDEIQFIVAKLNDSPFQKKLSLVDFDDKSPVELLQLLMDVFAVMDAAITVDVREVERDVLVHKVLTFLNILKYQLPEDDERDAMIRGLAEGEKQFVYPVLHWCLQRLPSLQKRAYLAKYLVPEPIPQEFMQDEVLVEIHNSHKQLQQKFKEVHKQVDKLRAEPTRPSEVKTEIATLEDERKQLIMKIERLKNQTNNEPGFAALLAATTSLRQQQDEDARLGENRRRQLMTLQHARQRLEDASKRHQALKNNQSGNATAEDMLRHLEQEVKDLGDRVNAVMPREIEQETEKLRKLQEEFFEPQRSREDVENMRSEVEQLEARCASLSDNINQQVASRGNDTKLTMFRQTAVVAAKKLAAKEEELEKLELQLRKVKVEIDKKETALSEISGPKFMTREELKTYGAKLREKTHVYKRMKNELSEMRAELVRLGRTEQILRGRDRNLEDFLKNLEEERGVVGYRDVQNKLEAASMLAMNIDSDKENTLEEISTMVKKMNLQLKERKSELAPQIKKLREVRKEFSEVDTEYKRKKGLYDKVAIGLEVEKLAIEAEADQLQAEALQEESNYHYIQNLTAIAQASVDRVRNEEMWASGQGHLLPNFRTYADLYRDKEARQKSLKEQLQKQKAAIQANEPKAMDQRKHFEQLAQLLGAKVKSASKLAEVGFSSSEFSMGDAKVMRLDLA